MDALKLKSTKDTPWVFLDPKNNIFEITGKSFPEDADKFYKPILAWLDAYAQSPNPKTNFKIKIKYFNSVSVRIILDMIIRLSEIYKNGNEVLISWQYSKNNRDMKKVGEEYAKLSHAPFELIPLK